MPDLSDFALTAGQFAKKLGGGLAPAKLKSTRFLYFSDGDRLVVAVPPTSDDADWALVYGLAERKQRHLTLILPSHLAFATQQRVPWLTDEARPDVWLYEGRDLHLPRAATRQQTIDLVSAWANKKGGPVKELEDASRPLHLGNRKTAVQELADWATSHPQLDAAHRRGQRSWHVAGQRVLTFASATGGELRIIAGIQDKSGRHWSKFDVAKGGSLTESQLEEIYSRVTKAIAVRLDPHGPYQPDEHWLQAALRREPSLVGVESPALREVPAWRPAGERRTFSRGYLDLMGLDGQGDVRIVEAKIAKSTDEMTLFQGVDYMVWAAAYKDAIKAKLSAPAQATFHLHFVVGAMDGTKGLLPARIPQYADALDTDDRAIRYHFHVVSGWQSWRPDARPKLMSTPHPKNTLPS